MMFDQHLPSNVRTHTDTFLANLSSEYSEDRNKEEIQTLCSTHNYVTVTDIEVAALRESTGNVLSRGDATSKILQACLDVGYEGLLPDREMEVNIKGENVIETSMYSFEEERTYYFIAKGEV